MYNLLITGKSVEIAIVDTEGEGLASAGKKAASVDQPRDWPSTFEQEEEANPPEPSRLMFSSTMSWHGLLLLHSSFPHLFNLVQVPQMFLNVMLLI